MFCRRGDTAIKLVERVLAVPYPDVERVYRPTPCNRARPNHRHGLAIRSDDLPTPPGEMVAETNLRMRCCPKSHSRGWMEAQSGHEYGVAFSRAAGRLGLASSTISPVSASIVTPSTTMVSRGLLSFASINSRGVSSPSARSRVSSARASSSPRKASPCRRASHWPACRATPFGPVS